MDYIPLIHTLHNPKRQQSQKSRRVIEVCMATFKNHQETNSDFVARVPDLSIFAHLKIVYAFSIFSKPIVAGSELKPTAFILIVFNCV